MSVSTATLDQVGEIIKKASSVVLSTHREPDGDGLGSELAMFYALKHLSKKVRILNLDPTPGRYNFLKHSDQIESFRGDYDKLEETDLALIFDTNDPDHVGPLFDEFSQKCKKIIFVDHHISKNKDYPDKVSFLINKDAASAGEVVYELIKSMKITMDSDIARAIYTAVCFDTQVFKYIRGSSQSHKIAVELLEHEKSPETVHREIFGNYSIRKMDFLSKTISELEYMCNNQVGVIYISSKSMLEHNLSTDDTGDIIDIIMKVDTLKAVALFREDAPSQYKLSLRSRGSVDVFKIARSFGGGGHFNSSGAMVTDEYSNLKAEVVKQLTEAVR